MICPSSQTDVHGRDRHVCGRQGRPTCTRLRSGHLAPPAYATTVPASTKWRLQIRTLHCRTSVRTRKPTPWSAGPHHHSTFEVPPQELCNTALTARNGSITWTDRHAMGVLKCYFQAGGAGWMRTRSFINVDVHLNGRPKGPQKPPHHSLPHLPLGRGDECH